MRRRPIRGNLRLDPEDQGQQKYDKYSKNKDSVGEKMKWILIFFALVFGVIFCVVQLGGKAKQHLKGGIDHIKDNYAGGLRAKPVDTESLRKQMDDRSDGHRVMNPDQEAYGDMNEEYLAMERGQDAEDTGYAQYENIQEYDVDDGDLLEDIEDDLPPLQELEKQLDEEELLDVTDDSDLQNIDDVALEEGADILEDEEPAPELDVGNIEDDLPEDEMPLEEDVEEEVVEYDAGQIDEEPASPAEGDAEAILETDLEDLNPNEVQAEKADVEAEDYIPLEEMEIEENDQGQERIARHREKI